MIHHPAAPQDDRPSAPLRVLFAALAVTIVLALNAPLAALAMRVLG